MIFFQKAKSVREYELTVIHDKHIPPETRFRTLTNYLGRQIILGSAVGILRVTYGIVKSALCSIAVLFLTVSAKVMSPFNEKISTLSNELSEEYLQYLGLALLNIGRGLVESLPIAGQIILVEFDYNRYKDIFSANHSLC
jgi:hypothetical protein